MKLLAEQWSSYVERVLLPEASVVQVVECRRAFYAGAEGMMRSILRELDPGSEPTDRDLAKMDSLEAELRDFAKDVAEGRA